MFREELQNLLYIIIKVMNEQGRVHPNFRINPVQGIAGFACRFDPQFAGK